MPEEVPIPEHFRDGIRDVVRQLAGGNYADLVADGRAGSFTAELLQNAMGQFNLTLLELPDDVWASPYAVAFYNERHKLWSIDVPLWTEEEGLSDFTLQLSASDADAGTKLVIEELHVL